MQQFVENGFQVAHDLMMSMATYDGQEADDKESAKRLARIDELQNGGDIRASDERSRCIADVHAFMHCETQ